MANQVRETSPNDPGKRSNLADNFEGTVISIDRPDMFDFTRHDPLGVVRYILPWNKTSGFGRLAFFSSKGPGCIQLGHHPCDQ
jgi:hypothetical protein